jgi:prepilin-type N-terminal cleavage/methylation domain-containing protein
MRRQQSGFSLLELVVVLLIIAVITTVAVTVLLRQSTGSGRAETRKPEALVWGAALPGWPGNSAAVTLPGTWGQTGGQNFRIRLDRDTRFGPHWHIRRTSLTVISGRLELGFGGDAGAGKVESFEAGAYIALPGRTSYFGRAAADTVLQISSEVPLQTLR